MYQLADEGYIVRSDGAMIPADPANRDYSDYLAWVEAGNVAQPVPPDTDQLATAARGQRDALLRASDWTQMVSDAPLNADQRAAWATYRAALRAIPDQAGFPLTVEWPTAPEAVAS